jgi:hypothetical protein
METPESQQPDEAGLNAPPKLVSALRRAHERDVFIPRTVDDRIVRAAELHFQKPEPPRFDWLRVVKWGTAAAVIALLALVVSQFGRRPPAPADQKVAATRQDENHAARVDILDAFALARQLQRGEKPGLRMDVNGDGVVDERDVAALAAKAVELPKGGPS